MSDAELERLRKKAKKRYVVAFLLCGGLFLVSLALFCWDWMHGSWDSFLEWLLLTVFVSGLLTAAAFCIFYFLLIKRAYEDFNKAYKECYVLSAIAETGLFSKLQYNPKSGFTYEELSNWGVLNCGAENHFASEDMLSGCYRNVRFCLCDVVTRRPVKRGKTVGAETVFQGQVLRFDGLPSLNAGNGRLQIFEREYLLSFKGGTAAYKVKTSNAAFDKRFQVYTEDEHSARSILTAVRLEKILTFANAAEARIAVAFLGNVMFVAVYRTKSLFDAYVDKPVLEQRQEILKDIELLRMAGDLLL